MTTKNRITEEYTPSLTANVTSTSPSVKNKEPYGYHRTRMSGKFAESYSSNLLRKTDYDKIGIQTPGRNQMKKTGGLPMIDKNEAAGIKRSKYSLQIEAPVASKFEMR